MSGVSARHTPNDPPLLALHCMNLLDVKQVLLRTLTKKGNTVVENYVEPSRVSPDRLKRVLVGSLYDRETLCFKVLEP